MSLALSKKREDAHPLRDVALGFAADFSSSWTSIGFSLLFSHPLDTLRVRQQVKGATPPSLKGLYHGVQTPLVTTGPSVACAFALNDAFKRLVAFGSRGDVGAVKQLELAELCVSGGLAGCTSALVNCPVSVVRVQQQIAATRPDCTSFGGKVPGFFHVWRQIFRHEGLWGLYRGLPNEAMQAGLGRMTYFTVYEEAKRTLQPMAAGSENPYAMTAATVASAVLASWTGWTIIYPLDVLKNRLQGDYVSDAATHGGRQYKGLIDCARKSYKQLGFRALWVGLPTTLARGMVSSGISLPAYDYLRPSYRNAFGVSG